MAFGIGAWLITGELKWIVGTVVFTAVGLTIPAVIKIQRIAKRDDS